MAGDPAREWKRMLSRDMGELLDESRNLSRRFHGRKVDFYIPGRMKYLGEQGKYPSISLTGASCALKCDHCYERILEGMIPAKNPSTFKDLCGQMDDEGNIGILLSGGSNGQGSLPWNAYLDAIGWVKAHTGLRISIHTGLVSAETAMALKEAGVDEFLIDVVGSNETIQQVYHLREGIGVFENSLDALARTGLPLIPHIVVGLHYGEIRGEMQALEMVARYPVSALVVVVLTPLRHTPMEKVTAPEPTVVARFAGAARLKMPQVPLSLSCARPLGRHREDTDLLALEAGVNRIAMPDEKAVQKAGEMGLEVRFHKTCCSNAF